MTPKNNRQLIILFSAAALAIIILAGAMAGLPFDPSRAFAEQPPLGNIVVPEAKLNNTFLLILYLILIVLAVLALFLSREGRRMALIMLALIGITSLVMYQAIGRLTFQAPAPTALLDTLQTPLPTEIVETPAPVIEEEAVPIDAPEWLVTAIGVVLAFLLTGALGLLYLVFSQRKSHLALSEALADEAEQAAAAILGGEEIRDVILRCYAQMVHHLEESRNLPRGRAVTPREFEYTLVRLGFPAAPLQTLTRLFEAVRYGHQATTPEQTQLAIDSLQAIVKHTEEMSSI